jgi:hypothetical protein
MSQETIEKDIKRVAQKLSFGADISEECLLIVAAARILLKDYG